MASLAMFWRLVLRQLGWLLGVVAIFVVVGAVSEIGGLMATATMLLNVRPGWLLAALALQSMSYAGIAAG